MAKRKTGSQIPAGFLRPTTPVDDAPPVAATEEERGGDVDESTVEVKLKGRRIYLSDDVHYRLKLLAILRGEKISEVAEDVLDKALPKWDVNRVG